MKNCCPALWGKAQKKKSDKLVNEPKIHPDGPKGSNQVDNVINTNNIILSSDSAKKDNANYAETFKVPQTQNKKDYPVEIPSKFSFTTMIERDKDLKETAVNIENFLQKNDVTIDDKLRKMVLILKDFTEPSDETFDTKESIKNFQETFLGMVDKYFSTLVTSFKIKRRSHTPIIKLLEVCELMLENYGEDHQKDRKEFLDPLCAILQEKILHPDWRSLRKFYDRIELFNIRVNVDTLSENFIKSIEKNKASLVWRPMSAALGKSEQIINSLLASHKKNPEEFLSCLKKGRFDKKMLFSENSLILGDEGGLYMLLNTVANKSNQEGIILESVSSEYLTKMRSEEGKVILGKGAFGKVRLALSIFGNDKVDIGQLVCIKKSLSIGKKRTKTQNTLPRIIDSTFEDFFSNKFSESIHAPKIIDMAIVTNEAVETTHRKGYLIMEIFPENTADKVFSDKKYQKWEYQKPYATEVLKTMLELLTKGLVFNSDLKPANTLFDPLSRKMAIIDLGSSLLVEEGKDIMGYDVSLGGFGMTDGYCPPEIIENRDQDTNNINLLKAISYLCGVTIAEITSEIPEKGKKNPQNWDLAKKTDLDESSLIQFRCVLKGLLDRDPKERIFVQEAIDAIKSIGSDDYLRKSMFEQYIEKLKESIKKDPSLVSLNPDITETNKKGVIAQSLVPCNPRKIKSQFSSPITIELDKFFQSQIGDGVFLLLGDAGSGKSMAIQLRFLQEVEHWHYGKGLPIYFNMADENDLNKAIMRLNGNLGCNLKLDGEGNEEIRLFIDSYDEGSIKNPFFSEEINTDGRRENVLEGYYKALKSWKLKKIVISCRTDYILTPEGHEDFYDFEVQGSETVIRYITPIGFGIEEHNKQIIFETLVEQWLEREKIELSFKSDIVRSINYMRLAEKMKTGMMFNMIMKMLVCDNNHAKNNEKPKNRRLRSFEIYGLTTREEYNENWKKIVEDDINPERKKKKELAIRTHIIDVILKNKEGDFIKGAKELEKEGIWVGLERIGETLAAEMMRTDKNRIKFDHFEDLVRKKKNIQFEEEPLGDEELKPEFKILYHLFRLMGLKLERKKVQNSYIQKSNNKNYEFDTNQHKAALQEELHVGFRHETYKNYYLLKGMKRVLTNIQNATLQREDDGLLMAVLDGEKTRVNYEFLRLVGEELKFESEDIFRKGLRGLLEKEKILYKTENANTNQFEKNSPNRRAATIISLLVAGEYLFINEDLGGLNLRGANLRGGMFYGATFESTDLRESNLRHANVSRATFLGADLCRADVGVRPDLWGHSDDVTCVCWSPDGKKAVSGSHDRTLRIWDTLVGKNLKTLTGHEIQVTSVSWNSDGNWIASGGGDKTVKIWDASEGTCLKTLEGHEDCVTCVSWSPDGKAVASGSRDLSVSVWDSVTGECIQILIGHEDPINCLCWNADGTNIASGSTDKTIRIWDIITAECLMILEGHTKRVNSVNWSLDGLSIISASDDKTLKVWNCVQGECSQTFIGHNDKVLSADLCPDGKKVTSGSIDKSIKVWDYSSGECLATFQGHLNKVNCVKWCADSKRIASASSDRTVKIWETVSGECVQYLEGHSDSVRSVSYSPIQNKIVSGAQDKTIRVWDIENGVCNATLEGHKKIVNCVTWNLDGSKIASASDDNMIRIWNSSTGECELALNGHSENVTFVSWSPDSKRLASGSGDRTLKIWAADNGEILNSLEEHQDQVVCLGWDESGNKLASGSWDCALKIWNADSGKSLNTLTGHTERISSVFWGPDGNKIVSGSYDKTLKIWNITKSECEKTLEGHEDVVSCVNWNSKNSRIASGSWDSNIKIWCSDSGVCLKSLYGHGDYVSTVVWNPDGKMIISGSWDNSIRIWEEIKADDWKMRRIWRGAEERFLCKGSKFVACKIEETNDKDIGMRVVILQGEGEWRD